MKKILSLFLLIYCFATKAQSEHFQFDNFTTDNGLFDHYTTCLHQDKLGWLWIGTGMGIERFDGINFKRYQIHQNDSSLLSDFLVRNFFETQAGMLLVGIEEHGLAFYNREKDCFEPLLLNGKPILTDVSVKCMAEDSNGNLWLATKAGLQKVNFKNKIIEQYVHIPGSPNTISSNYVRKIAIDKNNILWIGTRNGLDKFNPDKIQFTHLTERNSALGDNILALTIDSIGKLWVGTGSHGLYVLHNDTITEFTPLLPYERSDKVNCILQEAPHQFWIGTRGGLFSYNENTKELRLCENDPLNSASVAHNSIMDILKDSKGDLWIATRGGISYLVKEKQSFKNYTARPNNNQYLNNNEVYCIWQDSKKNMWFGTERKGINILDKKSGLFRYLTKENSALSDNCIKAINSNGNGKILIGTFGGGLNVYDEETGEISVFMHNPEQQGLLSADIIWDIYMDKNGLAWIATASGLDLFNPNNNSFTHISDLDVFESGISWIEADAENDLWMGSEKIVIYRPGVGIIKEFDEKTKGIFKDENEKTWLLTAENGMALYDKSKGVISYFNKEKGAPSNLTYCMLKDKTGQLWVSTAHGLARFDPEKETFRNYFRYDGIQGNQFHYGAAFQTADGEIFFGGINGVTSFYPDKITKTNTSAPIYLTDFKIFNKSINITDNSIGLKESISTAKEIQIPYKYNVITFEFAALNYTNSQNIKYKYLLEGFDKEWNETEPGNRKATYTNLNPGEYIFKVSTNSGSNNPEATVRLIVIPPFYMQSWFIMLTGALILLIAITLFISILKRREQRKTIEFEKIKVQKLHELDTFKLNLFTNISHEIKTPLTLIISPLKKILKTTISDSSLKENLQMMERNASQLMTLVSQLLDYRKLQDGQLETELKRGDIVLFSKAIFNSFKDLLEEKQLVAQFNSVQQEMVCYFDDEKLRRILNNLLSNAIRYNKPRGSVACLMSSVFFEGASYIKMEVNDSGIGISEQEQKQIFDRYYRSPSREEYASSGIGLAYTKEMVELLNGKLLVDSELGKGSTFTVMLPFIEDEKSADAPTETNEQRTLDFIHSKEFEEAQKTKKVVLVIEDNADVRQFITSEFQEQFIILEAKNGSEGLDIAIKAIPDLILSDVMMPGISGFELCEKIKADERTSHIPVILLTALSSTESEKEGLTCGADDYITKPFDSDILMSKMENLINMRQALIEKYSKQINLLKKPIALQSPDEKFLEKTLKFIEANLSNKNLDVDLLIDNLAVSRMQLYRKVSALTGMTVKELVNDIRLKRAEQIFREKKLNVSEVADLVGFSDTSYFGKCFKKHTGMSPTDYIKKNQ